MKNREKRMAGPRRIATKTERETVTTNVPLAITGARGRETERGKTGLCGHFAKKDKNGYTVCLMSGVIT